MDRDADVLLAVADSLVLAALVRAWQRSAGRGRWDVPAKDRHTAYLARPVPEAKIDAAMADSWHLLPVLTSHLHLDVDWQKLTDVLDGYTRAMLMAGQHHTVARLRDVLAAVDLSIPAWEDDETLAVL